MIKKSDLTPNEAINSKELCTGRLCGKDGVCSYHMVNVSLIEDRTISDVRIPALGSIVLVAGHAFQSGGGLDGVDENGFVYAYDLHCQYANWSDIWDRAILVYEAKENHEFTSPWRRGMPVA